MSDATCTIPGWATWVLWVVQLAFAGIGIGALVFFLFAFRRSDREYRAARKKSDEDFARALARATRGLPAVWPVPPEPGSWPGPKS